MPSTARRAKSEAYEKGIREGTAMAKRSRGSKPAEEEEMDMGMDPKHSRKRSAKGAKNTKPAKDGMGMKKPMDGGMYGKKPMDGDKGMKKEMEMDMYGKKPMDTECGCKGKKGRKCDGNCGSMRKRSDSLTPQEYLTACEMGIQDLSATYIRARLDTAEARNDLKCGKGAISEGEKCTKGPAQRVQSAGEIKRAGKTRETRIAAAYKAKRAQEPSVRAIKLAGKKQEARIAATYKTKRAKLKASGATRQELRAADMKAATQLAKSYDKTSALLKARKQRLRESDMKTAMQLARSYDKTSAQLRARKRRDSVYAAGFAPNPEQLAI